MVLGQADTESDGERDPDDDSDHEQEGQRSQEPGFPSPRDGGRARVSSAKLAAAATWSSSSGVLFVVRDRCCTSAAVYPTVCILGSAAYRAECDAAGSCSCCQGSAGANAGCEASSVMGRDGGDCACCILFSPAQAVIVRVVAGTGGCEVGRVAAPRTCIEQLDVVPFLPVLLGERDPRRLRQEGISFRRRPCACRVRRRAESTGRLLLLLLRWRWRRRRRRAGTAAGRQRRRG